MMICPFFDEDSGNVTFSSDELGVLTIDLNNINLDDINFDEDDSETIIHVRIMAWHNRLKQQEKRCKQTINACSVASERWWDCCMSKDEEKEIDPIFAFTDKVGKC